MREAMRSLQAYLDEAHRIGRDVPESAIKAKLFADGVQRVELNSPASDIRIRLSTTWIGRHVASKRCRAL
nr:hypothetical protein [Xanthomonas euroxanthea]